jgi:TonB family protein
MAAKKSSLTKKQLYLLAGGAAVCIFAVLILVVSFLLRDDEGSRQRQIQTVTLITPPPPPKIEEQLPEPEKPEEKIEAPPEEKPVEEPEPAKEPPPSNNLGLDADAGLGGDDFGLQAKKGGSSLIGGNGTGSVYGWYANVVSSNLQKTANDIIQKDGGVPPGQWGKVTFEVMVDVFGKVTKFSILKSSGNEKIDGAVKKALQMARPFEPPPPGMPKVLRFAVSLQG